MIIEQFIQQNTSLTPRSISATLRLLEEGATIPFISRYRKDMTGALDEVQIANIRDTAKDFNTIITRKKSILESIQEQGKLSNDLKLKIESCFDSTLLEDLYLPYKQKRQTKGDKAKKIGLEPLARILMSQGAGNAQIIATKFLNDDVEDEAMALQGAVDIMAEWMNENTSIRSRLRNLFSTRGNLQSKLNKNKKDEGEKYRDLYEFSQNLSRVSSHRLLAIIRGEREGILSVKAQPEKEQALEMMERYFVKSNNDCSNYVVQACKESYTRLLCPSLETEALSAAKERADIEAIKVFTTNLRQLLLASPLGSKRILAIDPGFKSGCKIVCLDEQGTLLHNENQYPHPPQNEREKAQAKIAQLVQAYKIDAIAIGDGTAGRETEDFISKIRFDREIQVFSVNEDGASIYSASPIARKEFPDFDVTVRGAVSIGRRLADPLAELVKIDPKSLGVGQYQHDVNQGKLKTSLDDVVMSCVNTVGVDVNTASAYLLEYVAGLGPQLANNIIEYRTQNGAFTSRDELKTVKRLGDKAFEQAAGFLRIKNAENPLDDSAVHPETYKLVTSIAKKAGITLKELIGNVAVLNSLNPEEYKEVDSYTFSDILKELKKPSRDPRSIAKVLEFDSTIRSIENVRVGMTLPGLVTNVTAFGAFVNIGIKQNGLIHKSMLAPVYVEDPTQFIKLHEHVQVEVVEIDISRGRIGLRKV
jgi:protein Tex